MSAESNKKSGEKVRELKFGVGDMDPFLSGRHVADISMSFPAKILCRGMDLNARSSLVVVKGSLGIYRQGGLVFMPYRISLRKCRCIF
jgi:hypothetical protein